MRDSVASLENCDRPIIGVRRYLILNGFPNRVEILPKTNGEFDVKVFVCEILGRFSTEDILPFEFHRLAFLRFCWVEFGLKMTIDVLLLGPVISRNRHANNFGISIILPSATVDV